MKMLRRLLLLTLCLLLASSPALAAGMRFSLRLRISPDAFPQEQQALCAALSDLLEAACFEGVYTASDDAFDLQAALLMGDGAAASRTTCHLFGTDSHWGVRSSLLGDTELMVNCAALLPFGQKARNYLGLPLDHAALLVPYTHVHALSSVTALIAPLFPVEDGRINLSRAEMDAMVNEFSRLCDEDPALYLWLETTGLYSTAKNYCRAYFAIPELLLPSLTVRRSGDTLTWKSGLFTLLDIRRNDGVTSCTFSLPTLASAEATLQQVGNQLTCSASVDMDSLQASVSAVVPLRLSPDGAPISLTVDVVSPILHADGLHLRAVGETHGNSIELQLLDPDTSAVLLTLDGTLIPVTPDTLPAHDPDDLTGVNVLSVNGDSLRALLNEVKWPLLTGVFDLVVAAPAPAVQALMDYAEDSGLIDLLTDATSGGAGY